MARDVWEEHFDEQSGVPYFSNRATGETVWERPGEEDVWEERVDVGSGVAYYFNVATGESVWEKPTGWPSAHLEAGWLLVRSSTVEDVPRRWTKLWCRRESGGLAAYGHEMARRPLARASGEVGLEAFAAEPTLVVGDLEVRVWPPDDLKTLWRWFLALRLKNEVFEWPEATEATEEFADALGARVVARSEVRETPVPRVEPLRLVDANGWVLLGGRLVVSVDGVDALNLGARRVASLLETASSVRVAELEVGEDDATMPELPAVGRSPTAVLEAAIAAAARRVALGGDRIARRRVARYLRLESSPEEEEIPQLECEEMSREAHEILRRLLNANVVEHDDDETPSADAALVAWELADRPALAAAAGARLEQPRRRRFVAAFVRGLASRYSRPPATLGAFVSAVAARCSPTREDDDAEGPLAPPWSRNYLVDVLVEVARLEEIVAVAAEISEDAAARESTLGEAALRAPVPQTLAETCRALGAMARTFLVEAILVAAIRWRDGDLETERPPAALGRARHNEPAANPAIDRLRRAAPRLAPLAARLDRLRRGFGDDWYPDDNANVVEEIREAAASPLEWVLALEDRVLAAWRPSCPRPRRLVLRRSELDALVSAAAEFSRRNKGFIPGDSFSADARAAAEGAILGRGPDIAYVLPDTEEPEAAAAAANKREMIAARARVAVLQQRAHLCSAPEEPSLRERLVSLLNKEASFEPSEDVLEEARRHERRLARCPSTPLDLTEEEVDLVAPPPPPNARVDATLEASDNSIAPPHELHDDPDLSRQHQSLHSLKRRLQPARPLYSEDEAKDPPLFFRTTGRRRRHHHHQGRDENGDDDDDENTPPKQAGDWTQLPSFR